MLAAERGERAEHVVVALLPDEPARRDDDVGPVRGGAAGREARRVDPRRRDDDPSVGRALEQQRAPGALGRGEEEVGGVERDAACRRGRARARTGSRKRSRRGIVSQTVSTSRKPSRSFSAAGPVENHQPSSAAWTTSAPSSTWSSPR